MKRILIITFFFCNLLFSCGNKVEDRTVKKFVKPQIINSKYDTSVLSIPYQAEYVSEVFPTFIGKFAFDLEVDITNKNRYSDDLLYEVAHVDTIDVNGFELIVDYDQNIKYNQHFQYDSVLYDHFPIYFVNSTQTDKIFYGKDSYAFGIQEAQSKENGKWLPIEGKGFDFCGNGRWGMIVHPQEFILILMRRYSGELNTEMRVRFSVGKSIYVSNQFQGNINSNQFSIEDSSYYETKLRETNGLATNWLFYGAAPNEEEWTENDF